MCSPREIISQKLEWTSGRKEPGQRGRSPEGRVDNGRKGQWEAMSDETLPAPGEG